MNSIGNITTAASSAAAPLGAASLGGAGAAKESGEGSFKNLLLDSIKQVNTMQQDADHAVENLFTGGDVDPAQVLTAVQKADIAFRMMMQIRNKLTAAFQEIKGIQI
ncbi:MAG TPA: flagellar hook-basal body complex protein FliE [Pirellulales bacterium]|nr:flagellar hook-basal body complex protein FliE [Pirellulales bacterium]